MSRARRSPSLPIVLSALAVALSITLLVFWLLIVVREYELGPEVSANTWLIVLGSVAFAFIVVVLVLFAVYLVAEIREGRRQDRFIDSVTHELKSPLAAIRLGLETMGRVELTPERREPLRQMMLDDVERLHAFIDSILEASRLAHERGGHDLQPVPLRPLVEDVVSRTCARHRLVGETVAISVPPAMAVVTDRQALETIVANLVDNAVKYSDPPRQIAIRASARRQGRVLIEVEDNGIGIEHSELQRVLQRFYRAPVDSVRRRRGTGLGLYVVAALVSELNGRLRLDSDGPNAGTRARVWLPGLQPERGTTPGNGA